MVSQQEKNVDLFSGHKSAVLCISFSPDGRFLASGSSDRRVLVWDIAYGHLLAELSHHTRYIEERSFWKLCKKTIDRIRPLTSKLSQWLNHL